jgi:hypothetical protein
MDSRAKFLAAFLCVAAGAGLWFLVSGLMGPSAAQWEAQVAQDATDLVQVVGHEPWVEDEAAVFAAWDKRKALYDQEHLAELRSRLHAYVEADMAAHAEAKSVYLSGERPERTSAAMRAAEDRLREAYGDAAEPFLARWRDDLLEAAFQASPVTAGGEDPTRADFAEIHDRLASRWLPLARERVERLTRP